MSESTTTEPPIMLRAKITRDELAELKVQAIYAGIDVQDLLARLIREWLASE